MADMTQEEVARMLWEVDQRIAFGHVKAPWATATARPAAYARKRAEQILAQGFRVLQPGGLS